MLITLVLALFNFPMENPFPFIHTIVIGAIGLRQFGLEKEQIAGALRKEGGKAVSQWQWKDKLCHAGTALGLIFLFFGMSAHSYSHWVEFNRHFDSEASTRTCKWYPSNWKPCMNLAKIQIHFDKLKDAEGTLKAILGHWPNHFIARRFLALAYFKQGRRDLGCIELAKFEKIFEGGAKNPDHRGISSITDKNRELCKEYWGK